jgi:hypothetical protein
MSRIYAGQSALRITVKTFTDLEGIISAVIKYRKPDGSTGEFAAGWGTAGRVSYSMSALRGNLI